MTKNWIPQVRRRLAQHLVDDNNKSTDRLTNKIHRFSARDIYFNPARDQVATTAAPHLISPTVFLPPGHVVTDTLADGTPVFCYRDPDDSTVKAYVNQCRHRASPLIQPNKKGFTPQRLKGTALTCPYHAWTYSAKTGELKGVPGQEQGLPCLNKKEHSLIPVSCLETAGGIWLMRDNNNEMAAWSVEHVRHEVDPLLPANGSIIGYREWNLEANWQLLVETFLESYHVSTLHQETLGLVAHSNCMVTDVLDDYNFRMTVPLKNFENAQADDKQDEDCQYSLVNSFFGMTTTTYLLFPNTAISLLKRLILFLSIQPHYNSGSNSRVRAWGLAADSEEEDGLAARDFGSVLAGIEEDWECAEGIQRGLCADTELVYSRFEGANVQFLEKIGKLANQLQSDSRNK